MRAMLDRRRNFAFAVLALLALCSGLLIETFAEHTDDGCQVEIHCLACQLNLGTVTTVAASPIVLERLLRDAIDRVQAVDERLHSESVAAVLPSRAPPLA